MSLARISISIQPSLGELAKHDNQTNSYEYLIETKNERDQNMLWSWVVGYMLTNKNMAYKASLACRDEM